MPIYRVQGPDGSVLRIEGPDNASEADLLNAAKTHFSQQQPDATAGGGELSPFGLSTGIRTPEAVDRFLSGTGAGMMDLVQGAKQLFGGASNEDVQAKRALDASLKKTTAGRLGFFAGQAAPALATMPFAALSTIPGAAVTGASLGALEPTAAGESKLGNTLLGAAGGTIGQAGANLIGRAVAPIRGALNPEEQRLAQVLTDSGINLDLAQRTGSKPLRIVNSILDNLPITSGAEEAKRAGQSQAFTRAVMAKGGAASDTATPEAVDAAMSRLGGNFRDIYSRNSVKVDDPLIQSMVGALDRADNAAPIVSKTDKIMSFAPEMPGAKYQDIRTQLRTLQGATDPEVSQAAKDLKKALDAAATRSVSPSDAELLAQTRTQYGNMKQIQQALKSVRAVNGEVPPLALRQSVAHDPRYTTGGGDLNDLARSGARFLSDPVPNSGTAQRMFYQGLLSGGLGAGTFAGTGDPMKGLEVAGAGLLGPILAQKALNNGLLGNYLASGPQRQIVAEEVRRLLGPLLVGAGTAAVATRP